jgi:hypothetical protein
MNRNRSRFVTTATVSLIVAVCLSLRVDRASGYGDEERCSPSGGVICPDCESTEDYYYCDGEIPDGFVHGVCAPDPTDNCETQNVSCGLLHFCATGEEYGSCGPYSSFTCK